MRNEGFKEEQQNLDETIKKMKEEKYFIRELLERKKTMIQSGASMTGDEFVYSKAKKDQKTLHEAMKKPYFGRLDFEEDGVGETVYIGKKGIQDQNQDLIVFDWRNPFSHVYYNFSPGNPVQSYEIDTLQEEIEVEVKRKREFNIKDGKLLKMTQELSDDNSEENGVLSQEGEHNDLDVTDDFLREILEQGETTGYLKEIIATIQKEQDKAIRQPLNRNVVIQGAAGSGKSSIALHRISYLLFNNKNLKSDKILILGPNKLFISSFQDLLPELELEGIQQSTFEELVKSYMNIDIQSSIKDYYEDVLFTDNQIEQTRISFKGSKQLLHIMRSYVDKVKEDYVHRFKNINLLDELMESKQLEEIYNGYAYLPFMKRAERFVDHVVNHYKGVRDSKIKDVEKQYKFFDEVYLKDSGLDEESEKDLKAQMQQIRDYKIQKIDESFKQWRTKFKKDMRIDDPLTIYKKILSPEILESMQFELSNEVIKSFKDYKIEQIQYFDTPPIFYIHILLHGVQDKFSHIVVDEAQDFSVVHFAILKEITKTMTVLGDHEQSTIKGYGQSNWDHVINEFYNMEQDTYLPLETSYRSTKEIINGANTVLDNQFGIFRRTIHPINRSGEEIQFSSVHNGQELLEGIKDQIEVWQSSYNRIAIIHKDDYKAKRLAEYLQQAFGDDVTFVSPDSEGNHSSISVLSSYQSKGMEFDAVILVNINEDNFPQEDIHARLLYILLTRAQQEVKVFYEGKPSKLLENLVKTEKEAAHAFDDIL